MPLTYHYTKRTFLIGILLLLLSLYLTGGGHGYYVPLLICFPWMGLGLVLLPDAAWPVALGLLQYPLYGLALDQSATTNQTKRTGAFLILTHLLLAAAALLLRGSNWS